MRVRRTVRALSGGSPKPPRELERFQVPGTETFFGYYDASPLHADGRRVLANVAPAIVAAPTKDRMAQVGYFDRRAEGRFFRLDETSSWCWQMGCRLRWFPDPGAETVIYNKLVDGRPGAVIRHVADANDFKTIARPLYDFSPNGDVGFSLNFSRLAWLRPGYGYADFDDARSDVAAPCDDGIWRIDLASNKPDLIVSLDDLRRIEASAAMDGAVHYVNHISVNPDGTRFIFFHLWVPDLGNHDIWHARVFAADCDGGNLALLVDQGRASHYTWRNARELAIFVLTHGHLGAYVTVDGRTGRQEPLWPHLPDFDGHQSFSPDGRWLLTDSYPDGFGEQRLLVFHEDGAHREVGRFKPGNVYRGEVRCDLHPRWDAEGKHILFDSSHRGGRALYLLPTRGLLD